MDWKEARNHLTENNFNEAVSEYQKNGRQRISKMTGRKDPRSRFIDVAGDLYAAKALCYRALQLAGANFDDPQSRPTVNEVVAPFLKFRIRQVTLHARGGPDDKTTIPDSEGELEAEADYRRVLARPAQQRFRKALIAEYGVSCAISGNGVEPALEAAHIRPFRDGGADSVANGLLLRADLHRLFDADLVAIEPKSLEIRISKRLLNDYGDLEGRALAMTWPATPIGLHERWTRFVQWTA